MDRPAEGGAPVGRTARSGPGRRPGPGTDRDLVRQRLELLLRRFQLGLVDPQPVRRQNRKSTRLNSSHVKTSYAVFCLKKKNNIRINGNMSNLKLFRNRKST